MVQRGLTDIYALDLDYSEDSPSCTLPQRYRFPGQQKQRIYRIKRHET